MMMDPYQTGVLQKAVHSRLVADIDNVAKDASIQPSWIWTPLAKTCAKPPVDWVVKFRRHKGDGVCGLALVGSSPKVGIEDQMSAIAGALVRNFIRARVLTVGQALEAYENGEATDLSCMLIPNFFLGKAQGGHMAPWHISALYDLMLARHNAGLQTVVYVSDMDALANEYGVGFRSHLQKHYKITEA